MPRDGQASGNLQVRGPWVIRRYFKEADDAADTDNWFDTGDVAALHPDGTMQITDRSKDVIKSGGEWISSIELENAAVGFDGVAEAAAIGIAHPKWDERPLLVVVCRDGCTVDRDELPHTATGKLSKKTLREQFKDYRFAGAEAMVGRD